MLTCQRPRKPRLTKFNKDNFGIGNAKEDFKIELYLPIWQ